MTWNYRVFKHKAKTPDEQEFFQIHEAYYNEPSDTPHSWTETPGAPFGDTLAELQTELDHMQEALKKPVLDYTPAPGLNL